MRRDPLGPDDLRALDEALAPDAATLEAWIDRASETRPRKRRWPRALLGAAAIAAIAAVVVGIRVLAPTTTSLQPSSAWQSLSDGLDVVVDGTGELEGDGSALRWTDGTLRVSVRPNAGLAVSVDTPEARIVVVGTLFEVDRSRFGTRVRVDRGQVEVACAAGALHRISADQGAVCAADPAGALALAVQAEAPGDVLDAVAAGLAHPQRTPLLDGELRALRVGALLDLDRFGEAAAEVDALDPIRPTQRDALRRIALAAATCEESRDALAKLAPTDAGAAIRLAGCTTDRSRALQILEAARPAASDEERAAIDAWREALPPAVRP